MRLETSPATSAWRSQKPRWTLSETMPPISANTAAAATARVPHRYELTDFERRGPAMRQELTLVPAGGGGGSAKGLMGDRPECLRHQQRCSQCGVSPRRD